MRADVDVGPARQVYPDVARSTRLRQWKSPVQSMPMPREGGPWTTPQPLPIPAHHAPPLPASQGPQLGSLLTILWKSPSRMELKKKLSRLQSY